LQHLLRVAINADTQQQVAATALQKIEALDNSVKSRSSADAADVAHNSYLRLQIERFRRNPKDLELPKPARLPAGAPIGACD
jgi:hypothetical protein